MHNSTDFQAGSAPSSLPLISVITVAFNDRDNLEQTIQSVLAQDCDDFEYIIVDGNSKDGSVELIERHAHRVARWVSEPDKGIYDAMNKGTHMARGHFVNYLNAGDTYASPQTLRKVQGELEAHAGIDVLYGRALNRMEGPGGVHYEKGKQITADTLFTSIPFCHQAMFFRRKVFLAQGGYNLQYRVIADYAWTVTYALACGDLSGFRFMDHILIKYLDGGFSFKNMRLAAREKLQLARAYHSGRYLLANYLSFIALYVKAMVLPMMEKWNLLGKYRKWKYKKSPHPTAC
jgi:glycosyltransferase involved in cell wall biosynthesis